MKRFFQTVAAVFLYCVVLGSLAAAGRAADRLDQTAHDPLNATYRIEGQPVALEDGRSELPSAPGSAMKVRTAVWKQPVFGDLDDDGDEDAVLVLIHDPGGSGTFYYVAVAINANGRYQGTNAVLLGDRIAPTDIEIRNSGIVVNYADRRPAEPTRATPSVVKTTVLFLENNKLSVSIPLGEKSTIIEGWVTIGHEVRSFEPCDWKGVLWLMGQSPAIEELMTAYRRVLPDEKNYRPVIMVLAGKLVKPPTEGFGADYEAAFLATQFVRVAPGEDCKCDVFDAETPIRAGQKITFDMSTLDEDGLFGPPGGKRALAYEFCIPDTVRNRTEVERIDSTVEFFAESPGRIGCGKDESLCIGTTHQQDFATILRRLAELTYVQRIDQSFFE